MAPEIAELRHPNAGTPTSQHVYRDEDGRAIVVANRFDKKDGKFFIPYDLDAQDWKAPKHRPLYRLDELTAANTNRPIVVTEGEKCADALAALGYVSTTTFGGAGAAHKTDLSALKDRDVIIWPDKDAAGRKYARCIAATLRKDFGTLPRIVPTSDFALRNVAYRDGAGSSAPNVTYRNGWDAADAIAEGWGVAEINALLSQAAPMDTSQPKAQENSDAPPLFDGMELWHTPDGKPFVSLNRNGHWETYELDGAGFRRLLSHAEYKATGKALPAAKLDDQLRQLQGEAQFEGEARPVFTRIGQHGESYVIDLGTADWSAVEISAGGWRVRQGREPRFKRSGGMAALPVPIRGSANLDLLRDFVNVGTDEDFRLLVGWLLGCLRPDGPYPLLILTGEQGSAKSTTSRVLRALVDPSTLPTRSFPTDERDLVIAAKGAHVLAFDNLSRVKASMADALCRLATGGGFATRKLHSDADEVLFNASRPCLLNGIPDLAERPDLADRAIALTLPTITPENRAYEGAFWDRFQEAHPRILSALLDGVAGALDRVASVRLAERPRMADFARWVTAAEPALGWPDGAFLAAYEANRKEAVDTALDGSALASAILAMVTDSGPWQGTAAELGQYLRKRYPALTETAEAFPRQAHAIGSELRRVAPLLRGKGIAILHRREGKERRRVIHITAS